MIKIDPAIAKPPSPRDTNLPARFMRWNEATFDIRIRWSLPDAVRLG